MARRQRAEVEIATKDSASQTNRKIARSYGEVEDSAKDAGESLEKDYTRGADKAESSTEKLGNALKAGLAAAAGLATAALVKLVDILNSAVEASTRQEAAVQQLSVALDRIDQGGGLAVQRMQEWASALQQATSVGDETILQLTSLALSFTNNAAEARKLTEAALDFSVAAGIGQEEALRRLGRSLKGSVDDLSAFDQTLRDLTKSQLANGEAIDRIADKYDGFAERVAQSYEGLRQAVENAQGDTLEILGENITRNDELADALRERIDAELRLQKALRDGIPILSNIAVTYERLKTVIVNVTTAIDNSARAIIPWIDRWELITEIWKEAAGFLSRLTGETAKLTEEVKKQEEAGGDLLLVFENLTRVTNGYLTVEEELGEAFKAAFEANLQRQKSIAETTRREQQARAEKEKMFAAINQETDATEDSTEEIEKNTQARVENIQVMQVQRQEAILTAQALVQIRETQGQSEFIRAALAAGGRLVQGGRVIELPQSLGGGSRLTAPYTTAS